MLTTKQLLLKQATEAFSGRPDMPLMASLDAISQEEASWQADAATPNIEQIVRHIAWSKSRYCQQGFTRPMVLDDPFLDEKGDSPDLPLEFPCGAAWGCRSAPGIIPAIQLLSQSQRVFIECLESCSDQALEQPIPVRHGASAAQFFWIMLMHDLYHAGQIRTRRTMYALWQRRLTE